MPDLRGIYLEMGKVKQKKKTSPRLTPVGLYPFPGFDWVNFNSLFLSLVFSHHVISPTGFLVFLQMNNHLDPSVTGNILNYSSIVQIPFVISLL